MTPEQREMVLSELVRNAQLPRNGQRAEIDARIRDFEHRYEMNSQELLVALREGRQRETAEIAQWLFLLQVREKSGR
ncbi:MAG: hypothetical protein ACOY71_04635 [Gemmatimonadota bacterium]